MGDTLHDPETNLYIEATRGADGDTAGVCALLRASRNAGADKIAGTKAEVVFMAGQITAREAISGEARALVRASTHALNAQGDLVRAEQLIDLADARCVQRMSFG